MAKNGSKIIDSDTHIYPHANVLDRYMSEAERKRLESWEPWKFVDPKNGHSIYLRCDRKFLRKLGHAEPEQEKKHTSLYLAKAQVFDIRRSTTAAGRDRPGRADQEIGRAHV